MILTVNAKRGGDDSKEVVIYVCWDWGGYSDEG